MQTRSFNLTGPPAARQVGLFLALAAALAPRLAMATDSAYVNYGNLTFPPQIDASNFVNYGTFSLSTVLPFQTANTHNFTNYGTLIGNAGFWFNNASPTDNTSQPADNFVNRNAGLVESIDVPSFGGLTPVVPNYVWVQAANIVNQGILEVGTGGELKLEGSSVDLSRSGVEVQALQGVGSFNIPPGLFFPDAGIYDLAWAQTNLVFDTSGIWNGRSASSPVGISAVPPLVADSFVATNVQYFLTVTNIIGYPNLPPVVTNVLPTNTLITNLFFPSNIVRQAAFIGLGDTNVQAAFVRYTPSSIFTNPFQTIAVEITHLSTNVVSQASEIQTVYLYDTLASETNRGINVNLINGTGRPANYNLTRVDDGTFFFGRPGNNGVPARNFLFDINSFSNNIAAGEYSAYIAFIDSLVSEPPPIPAGTVTNLPGRIRIFADTLNAANTRFRGEGEIMIQAKHLVSSTNAVVDCRNLSYTLASTNGDLHMLNLAKATVSRFQGDLLVFSALWTNSFGYLYSNNYTITNITDTNNVVIGTNAIQTPVTNTLGVGLHVLIIDASRLGVQLPVTTWELVLNSTNMLVSDTLTVAHALLLNGQSFTLDGNISLAGDLQDFIATNAPSLLYFTNKGTFIVPNDAHFGDDRAAPYSAFVNTGGTIDASSLAVNSSYFQNSGSLSVGGPITIQGTDGQFVNGNSSSFGLQLTANTLKLRNYRLTSSGGLVLNVAGALYDSGGGASNVCNVQDGFTLAQKPAGGDLLGTSLQTVAPDFTQVNHYWSAEDRGNVVAGFSNNVALGTLIIGPAGKGAPLFYFSGTGANNAIYTDVLDLSNLGTNFASFIQFDPSLNIYFAAARLGFTPPPNSVGVPQEPEEYLDGQLGGHLHWARSFAGPNSSVAVLVNGQTVLYNAALRFSKIIDSDGDGIPNFYDTTPFGGVALTAALVSNPAPQTYSLQISWNGAPGKVYQVEFTTDLAQGQWQPLLTYTNNSPIFNTISIQDTNVPLGVRRFYRVGYAP
jgi:hypothetical protein